jgi:hypothetical protein
VSGIWVGCEWDVSGMWVGCEYKYKLQHKWQNRWLHHAKRAVYIVYCVSNVLVILV